MIFSSYSKNALDIDSSFYDSVVLKVKIYGIEKHGDGCDSLREDGFYVTRRETLEDTEKTFLVKGRNIEEAKKNLETFVEQSDLYEVSMDIESTEMKEALDSAIEEGVMQDPFLKWDGTSVDIAEISKDESHFLDEYAQYLEDDREV